MNMEVSVFVVVDKRAAANDRTILGFLRSSRLSGFYFVDKIFLEEVPEGDGGGYCKC
jgi:hypothetical protein